MQQRFKGQAGAGGRGKDQPKNKQDVKTRRRNKPPKLATPDVPGKPSGRTPAKVNQKKNQREWHEERAYKAKKATRKPQNA